MLSFRFRPALLAAGLVAAGACQLDPPAPPPPVEPSVPTPRVPDPAPPAADVLIEASGAFTGEDGSSVQVAISLASRPVGAG